MIKATPELIPSVFRLVWFPQHDMTQNAVLPQFLFVAGLILAGNEGC
jgi:hypothetical protein